MGFIRRHLLRAWYRWNDRLLDTPTPREQELVEELRAAFLELAPAVPSGYSEAERCWVNNRNRLRDLVVREDPRCFLRWDVIASTMYVGDAHCIREELNHLKRSRNWNPRWKAAIQESPAGHPRPSYLYPRSSGNVIHHVYHLCQLEEKTGVSVEDLELIVEFGGGYGSMCRLINKLGFSGRYIILDLPEFSALQNFYLQLSDIPISSNFSCDGPGVLTISTVEALNKYMNVPLGRKSAFIGTWSISEAPLEQRESMLPLVSQLDVFLIAYQEMFCEVDNVKFFWNWRNSLGGTINWFDEPIRYLPGNRYLFGRKKDSFS